MKNGRRILFINAFVQRFNKKKKTYSPAKNGNAWFMAELCKNIEFWLREFFQSGD